MASLRVEDIGISFGGLKAVQQVSFAVEPGEIMGLIGPNGAGKTTTLNLISGLYTCDTGKVFLGDEDVTKVTAYNRARKGLARTFQTPRFLTRSTIAENMKLGTDLADQMGFLNSFFGKKGVNFMDEVDELMEIAELKVDWNEDISSLAYGQMKRLEIIRGLLSHPKVMLVDEPAAGLNSKELEKSVALIRHAAKKGVAIVLIEHKMDMIMNVCDHITVLNFGKMIAYGTPDEVSSNEEVIEAYLGRK
jgi:ABC-type branched-subunit amino acid transport system ATPase component